MEMSNLTHDENDLIDAIIRNSSNYVRSILTRCHSPLQSPNININCYNQYNETPLMIAVSSKNTSNEIIQTLLEHGAATNLKNNNTEDTALHIACFHGTSDTVKQLLLHGADTNSKNRKGRTPLYGPCHHYCTANDDKIKYIIEYNAGECLNLQDEDGDTVLHWLGNCRRVVRYDLIQMLLDYGADVKIRNIWGETPLLCFILHVRAINKNIAICNLLLKSNSNTNVQLIVEKPKIDQEQLKNKNDIVLVIGDTPFNCAIRNQNYSLVKMILDYYKPNIKIHNHNNETAYDIAKKIARTNNNNSNKILLYLEQKIQQRLNESYYYLLKTWMHQKEYEYVTISRPDGCLTSPSPPQNDNNDDPNNYHHRLLLFHHHVVTSPQHYHVMNYSSLLNISIVFIQLIYYV